MDEIYLEDLLRYLAWPVAFLAAVIIVAVTAWHIELERNITELKKSCQETAIGEPANLYRNGQFVLRCETNVKQAP